MKTISFLLMMSVIAMATGLGACGRSSDTGPAQSVPHSPAPKPAKEGRSVPADVIRAAKEAAKPVPTSSPSLAGTVRGLTDDILEGQKVSLAARTLEQIIIKRLQDQAASQSGSKATAERR